VIIATHVVSIATAQEEVLRVACSGRKTLQWN
jgi:hypothetical protein